MYGLRPNTLATLGANTYIVWAAFNFLFVLWIYFFVPETKQKSLEEIEEAFAESHTIGSKLIKRSKQSHSIYENDKKI